jgi:predicted CXXCH cytochrome family protein
MKKALIILGLAIVLSLALVGVASANNGPHGGFSALTDACAGCHRAHTALGDDYLLVQPSVYALCTTCHGSAGSGANTDVLDGLYINNRVSAANQGLGPLNGGGFLYMGGSIPANPTDAVTPANQTTSAHNVEGLPSRGFEAAGTADTGKTAPAWGGGRAIGLAWDGTYDAKSSVALECVSCHNPHGSSNYRILNDTGSWTADGTGLPALNTANSFAAFQVLSTPSDTGQNRYSNFPVSAGGPGIGFGGNPYLSGGNYTIGINVFCASCHQRYNTNTRDAEGRPRSSARLFVLGAPFTTSPQAQASQFPDWKPAGGTGAYDVGDGNGEVTRYRHTVGMQRTSFITANQTSWPLNQVRLAATDGVGLKVVTSVGANGGLVYSTAWDTSVTAVNSDNGRARESSYQTCLTCHYAHGTTATQTGFATKVISNGVRIDNPSTVGGVAAGVGPANDSALLFLDNRGVCRNCHRFSAVNGQYNSYSPDYYR